MGQAFNVIFYISLLSIKDKGLRLGKLRLDGSKSSETVSIKIKPVAGDGDEDDVIFTFTGVDYRFGYTGFSAA